MLLMQNVYFYAVMHKLWKICNNEFIFATLYIFISYFTQTGMFAYILDVLNSSSKIQLFISSAKIDIQTQFCKKCEIYQNNEMLTILYKRFSIYEIRSPVIYHKTTFAYLRKLWVKCEKRDILLKWIKPPSTFRLTVICNY